MPCLPRVVGWPDLLGCCCTEGEPLGQMPCLPQDVAGLSAGQVAATDAIVSNNCCMPLMCEQSRSTAVHVAGSGTGLDAAASVPAIAIALTCKHPHPLQGPAPAWMRQTAVPAAGRCGLPRR